MLIYRFWWADDGITDAGFLCDLSGRVQQVQVISTNAVLSQPFLFANASLKLLAAAILEELKDHMSTAERKLLKWMVDNSNSKMLLEWDLKLAQRRDQP